MLNWLAAQQNRQKVLLLNVKFRFLIDYINKKGLIETEKTEDATKYFQLWSKQVREIMVPAVDIIMINATLRFMMHYISHVLKVPVFSFTRL